MKGKKCIKYLILCITFLLSLKLCLNDASAATIKNLRREYVKSINFQTYRPDKTFSNQTIEQYVYSPVYDSLQENLPIAANDTFKVSALQVTLLNSVSANLNDNWELSFYVYVGTNQEFFIPTILCPAWTSTGMVIDSCETIYHDTAFEPYQQNLNTGDFYGWNKTFVELKIKGHFTRTQTGNTFNLSGPFLSIKNTNLSGSYFGWRFLLAFDSFKIYEYEENAEDEAAEKELEDRDNLETQQTESEDSAEDSSDSFETSTTNITGVISGFVTSLNNLQIGNCTLPEISAYGFSLGNINLCTFTPPTWIQGVTTVIISLITLGLAWHVFRRIMGIAKSLAGSK